MPSLELMTKRRVLIGACVLVLAVLLAGGGYALAVQFYMDGYGQSLASHAAFDAYDKTLILRALRRGDTAGAISLLEEGLDTNTLEHTDADFELDQRFNLFVGRHDRDYGRAVMSHVSEYREEHPSSQKDPRVRSMLSRELRKYPPKKCTPTQAEGGSPGKLRAKTPPN
jgi:hypothetical protein